MSDDISTASRVEEPGIRALYKLENRWQAWLDVEGALARAQAELGIIPAEAADARSRALRSWRCWTAPASTKPFRAPRTRWCRWCGN